MSGAIPLIPHVPSWYVRAQFRFYFSVWITLSVINICTNKNVISGLNMFLFLNISGLKVTTNFAQEVRKSSNFEEDVL
jgi:hypothetical protein